MSPGISSSSPLVAGRPAQANAPGPAVIVGRADGIWACTLAREWQRRGIPTVIVSKPVDGAIPEDVRTLVVPWTARPWLARARRLASRPLRWWQQALVRAHAAAFAECAGVAAAAPWEYDFVEPFWDGYLLSHALAALQPRFVLGQEVHSHGLAAVRYDGCPRFLFPWGSDIFTVIETSPIMFRLVRHALRKADLIVPSASSVGPYLEARFGVQRARIEPVSWGVDREFFHPAGAAERRRLRVRLGLPLDQKLVVNIRRFLPQWNSETVLQGFLECARRRPELYFVIVGGRYAEASLELARSAVREAGLSQRFRFDGELDLVTFRDLLRSADAFVSMNPRFDMRSVSVLQGAACGLVPILSEHPEYRSLQACGFDALFVPPASSTALASAVELAVGGEASFGRMVEGNLEYLAAYEDGQRQMDRLLEVLLSATRGSRSDLSGARAV